MRAFRHVDAFQGSEAIPVDWQRPGDEVSRRSGCSCKTLSNPSAGFYSIPFFFVEVVLCSHIGKLEYFKMRHGGDIPAAGDTPIGECRNIQYIRTARFICYIFCR